MEKEVKKIIEENPIALASVDNKGNPYCIAAAYIKVKEDKIIITNNYIKKTLSVTNT